MYLPASLDLLVTPTVGIKLQTNVMLSYKLFLSVMCVFKFCLSPFKKKKKKKKKIYIYIYIIVFSHYTFMQQRAIYSLSNGYTAYLYQYQNCIISNKLTCKHCGCAFVVLQLQSTNCQPYLNRKGTLYYLQQLYKVFSLML